MSLTKMFECIVEGVGIEEDEIIPRLKLFFELIITDRKSSRSYNSTATTNFIASPNTFKYRGSEEEEHIAQRRSIFMPKFASIATGSLADFVFRFSPDRDSIEIFLKRCENGDVQFREIVGLDNGLFQSEHTDLISRLLDVLVDQDKLFSSCGSLDYISHKTWKYCADKIIAALPKNMSLNSTASSRRGDGNTFAVINHKRYAELDMWSDYIASLTTTEASDLMYSIVESHLFSDKMAYRLLENVIHCYLSKEKMNTITNRFFLAIFLRSKTNTLSKDCFDEIVDHYFKILTNKKDEMDHGITIIKHPYATENIVRRVWDHSDSEMKVKIIKHFGPEKMWSNLLEAEKLLSI